MDRGKVGEAQRGFEAPRHRIEVVATVAEEQCGGGRTKFGINANPYRLLPGLWREVVVGLRAEVGQGLVISGFGAGKGTANARERENRWAQR